MDHDKMMKIIHDIFDPSLPRLAPGDDQSTSKALEMLYGKGFESIGEEAEVLDIGCGNGASTLCLAANLKGKITAVDNHQPYLDELEKRAQKRRLLDRIETSCADMNELDLGGKTFDLVWAEGSAFIMGVPEALQAWRSFLKPGGALGLTELTWLEEGAPDACREFFAAEYPQMTDEASHLATIKECGYELVGRFTLPESSWWETFYGPLAERMAEYKAPSDDDDTRAMVDMVHGEIEAYRNFSRWYGYVFFLMKKRG